MPGSGLAVPTISKVERGLMALTYDSLLRLARGLDMDLPALFGCKGASLLNDSLTVATRSDFQPQGTPAYSYGILFREVRHKAMTPMTGTAKARSRTEFSELIRHAGQEFVCVLSGRQREGRCPHPCRG